MKNLFKILITISAALIISNSSFSNNLNMHNSLLIVDSTEINKQKIHELYSSITSNAYIPVNFIDKNLIDNIKEFYNVMNTCKQIEKEIEEEKNKPFIIFDAPVIEQNIAEKHFPIG
ncbi:MAG: hypothetical protein A2046_11935 [Bacteroidetes bacterium GWA2_30_7]|nr:MAG: hypothetical protein A2046_11935 [Bacteroidetes bacterium GWA2_30_7]